jgi:hypothetical protein
MNGFVDLVAVTRDAESVWAADDSVRAEFGSKDIYLALRRAEAKGQSRTLGIGVTAFVKPTMQTSAPGQFDSEWDDDSALHAEFSGSKERYLAFRRAEQNGSVKILSPGAAHSHTQQAPLQQPSSGPSNPSFQGAGSLAERQAQVRQENVGRQFAGLPVLPVPQE